MDEEEREQYDDSLTTAEECAAIWQAVLVNAVQEAKGNGAKKAVKKCAKDSRNWLLGMSDDYLTVCRFAGVDPIWMRNEVKKALKKTNQVRKYKAGEEA